MVLSPEKKAEELITCFKIILMSEDTECGNEILCTTIAKKCSLVFVDKLKESRKEDKSFDDTLFQSTSEYSSLHPMYLSYWNQVEEKIKNY